MCAAKIFRKKKADAKDRVIADLRRQPDHRDKEIAELRAQVAALLARVTELEAKLNQNSSNSSRPPSSDPPGAPPPAPKKRSGRKPGGQPGHKGKSRKLLPEGDVDELHDHKPTECRGCGKRLHGADAAPLRHQVTEIPPITPHVSEHRLHALRCSCCDEVTRAVLPQGISRGAFGTRLQSVASVLSGAYRLSKRNVESLLADLFGVELSLGSIKALEDQTSAALAAPVEEAQRWVKEHPCAQLDETGWRHQNKRSWLWTAVAGPVASFLIRSSRAGKIAKELVGECFGGVVCSDRWSAYNWIDVLHRQICWAHLKRDFRKIAEMGGVAEALGEALEAQTKELFKHWHRVRDSTLKRSSFSVYASRIRVEVRALLGAGMDCCVS